MKKQDLWLIGVCLVICAAVFGLYKLRGTDSGKQVVVYLGDEVLMRCSLDDEADMQLNGVLDGTNHLVIKDGKADVTAATCPDQICVKQAAVSEIGEVIVCLPNQIIVAIEGEES